MPHNIVSRCCWDCLTLLFSSAEIDFMRLIPWRAVIVDEAHRLKNKACKLLEGLNSLRMVRYSSTLLVSIVVCLIDALQYTQTYAIASLPSVCEASNLDVVLLGSEVGRKWVDQRYLYIP